MGFFLDDDAVAAATKSAKNSSGAKRDKDAKAKRFDPNAVGCDHCPLRICWGNITSPRMKAKGNQQADVLILGHFPSPKDDINNQPISAKQFEIIKKLVPGRHWKNIAWQNLIRCSPTSGVAPDALAAHSCSVHLFDDVERINPKVIIGMGQGVLDFFTALPPAFSKSVRLTRAANGMRFPVQIRDRAYWFVPTVSPYQLDENWPERMSEHAALLGDIKNVFSNYDKWGDPVFIDLKPSNVERVETLEQAESALERMDLSAIGIDLETHKLRPYMPGARLLTAALSDGVTTIAFSVDHPQRTNDWALPFIERVLMKADRWIAHSLSMELAWIIWHFGYVPGRPEDTMALARINYERETFCALANVSRVELGIDVKSLSSINVNALIAADLGDTLDYNGLDALATALVYAFMRPNTHERNYRRIVDASITSTWMEIKGLPTNQDAARELHNEYLSKALQARREVESLYEARQFLIERQIEFNINNPEHVGEALAVYGRIPLPRTPSGKAYSTDDSILAPLAEESPFVKSLLTYREYTKLSGTYTGPIVEGTVVGIDLRVHPRYNTMLTATGRLSSEEPNIQNYPRRKHQEIRRFVDALIEAKKRRMLLLKIDYGQLEARVLAMAARDRAFCKAILEGFDVHGHWRDYFLKIYPEYWNLVLERANEDANEKAVMKLARDWIKNDFVFASFYGSTTGSCAKRMRIPEDIMTAAHKDFWREYRDIKRWIDNQRQIYKQTGGISTLTGRRRHGILDGNEPINTPIQGTAADLVLDAMNALAQRAQAEQMDVIFPRINIHDDLSFFVPDGNDLDAYLDIISEEMVAVRHDFQVVPLMIEMSIGPNWCDQEEFGKVTGDYVH